MSLTTSKSVKAGLTLGLGQNWQLFANFKIPHSWGIKRTVLDGGIKDYCPQVWE
jgi:hypothetical protein